MSKQLQEPIASYFVAANKHDVPAMISAFAEAAWVRDEGKERTGLAEIERWMDDTLANTDIKMEILKVEDHGHDTDVLTRLVGSFPGSPANLRFAFKVSNGKISRLEITDARSFA